MDLFQIEWGIALNHATHLLVAYILAFPIGWDREHSNRRFGLRTFPLVAVVTCGFMLVGMSVISSTDGEARIIQGIITGIGFIGGGAIFKDQDKVAGTASAASIWNTGAIGLAVAFDRLEIAVVLSIINVVSLLLLGKIKEEMETSQPEDQ